MSIESMYQTDWNWLRASFDGYSCAYFGWVGGWGRPAAMELLAFHPYQLYLLSVCLSVSRSPAPPRSLARSLGLPVA